MNTNNNEDTIQNIVVAHPEVKAEFEHMAEENRLILSRFTHELRNPLTLVRSTIQLIESQHPEVTTYKYWNQLLEDLDDTVSILNELSVYNHCDQLHTCELDFLQFLQRSVENARPLAASKQLNLVLTYDEPSNLYEAFHCDETKIKQAITNLLKNAIESAPEGTIIYIALKSLNDSKSTNPYIQLSITNSGVPMLPELLAHVFEPFVTTKSNGTGLGLAITKKIAELHHGNLSVSQTDCTITFTLQLPLKVADDVSLSVAL